MTGLSSNIIFHHSSCVVGAVHLKCFMLVYFNLSTCVLVGSLIMGAKVIGSLFHCNVQWRMGNEFYTLKTCFKIPLCNISIQSPDFVLLSFCV